MAIDGKNAILACNAGGIYYSSNAGKTWSASSTFANTIKALSVSISGSNAVASVASALYYSIDAGKTWTVSNQTGWFGCVSISGNNAVASSASATSIGIYYSSNYGQTWTISSTFINKFNFTSISISGQYAVLSNDSTGLYTSNNYGQTWTLSNLTAPTTRTTIYGANVISESVTKYYTSSNYGVTNTVKLTSASTKITLYNNYAVDTKVKTGSTIKLPAYSTDYGATWNLYTNVLNQTYSYTAITISGKNIIASNSYNNGSGTSQTCYMYYYTIA